MMRKKNIHFCVVAIISLLLITGCKQEENQFEILIFSSLPDEALAEMKGLATDEVDSTFEFNISKYPPVGERLIVEIVSHSGDILIMDRELLAAIYDTEELYNLTEFQNDENKIELTSFELEALMADGEITEPVDVYDNALKIISLEPYFIESEPVELVAVIPKYIKNPETALAVIQKLVK